MAIGAVFRRCALPAAAALALLFSFAHHATADVDRIEVLERITVANGKAFGSVGPYERLRGRLYFAVDANAAENQSIADIRLAPRDSQGRVHFAADFLLLRPLDPARGNGRLLYEVNNRGNISLLRFFNDAPASTNLPASEADTGNGFLMEQGYTLLATGWTWDALPGDGRLRVDLPLASEGGKSIFGRVAGEITVTQPTSTAPHTGIDAIGYEPARGNDPEAVLTVREAAFGPRTPIARERWAFGRKVGERTVYDPFHVTLEGGFKPGAIYTVTYLVRNPRVVGLGLAGIRDALLFFRHERVDKYGTLNPLAESGGALPKAVIAFGHSQSARVLQTMLFYGLTSDGRGRLAFDAGFLKVPGAGKGSFNHRFAQPTRHFSPDVELDFPTDWFPFSTAPQTDPMTNESRSVLDRPIAQNAVPRLFYLNTATEYWTRSASLLHTTVDGAADLAPDRRTRIYMVASDHHRIVNPTQRGNLAHCLNPLDDRPLVRSLLMQLDAWVTLKQEPPASVYPTIAEGTLGKLNRYIETFPKIPGARVPSRFLEPPRLNFGARFVSEGVADLVPPRSYKPYTTLVPLADGDGLDKGGIRLPDVTVPLGTYTGWNPQNAATGAPERLSRWEGSFVPFARNENERLAANDPRPSVLERYATRDAYRQAYAAATLALVEKGFLLGNEVNAMVDRAAALYDRVLARDPAGESCAYLAPKG
jgi:hypothetical protein